MLSPASGGRRRTGSGWRPTGGPGAAHGAPVASERPESIRWPGVPRRRQPTSAAGSSATSLRARSTAASQRRLRTPRSSGFGAPAGRDPPGYRPLAARSAPAGSPAITAGGETRVSAEAGQSPGGGEAQLPVGPVLPVGARLKRRVREEPPPGERPGVFRPKRNDERREATRFSRDGSPAEPPPGELGRVGFATG